VVALVQRTVFFTKAVKRLTRVHFQRHRHHGSVAHLVEAERWMKKATVRINIARVAANGFAFGVGDGELPRIFLNAKVQLRRLYDDAAFVDLLFDRAVTMKLARLHDSLFVPSGLRRNSQSNEILAVDIHAQMNGTAIHSGSVQQQSLRFFPRRDVSRIQTVIGLVFDGQKLSHGLIPIRHINSRG
jgi:hypothetical protein